MNTAYVTITLITATITAGIAIADFIPAGFVLANSAEVGVPRSWLPALGAAKLAGAYLCLSAASLALMAAH